MTDAKSGVKVGRDDPGDIRRRLDAIPTKKKLVIAAVVIFVAASISVISASDFRSASTRLSGW